MLYQLYRVIPYLPSHTTLPPTMQPVYYLPLFLITCFGRIRPSSHVYDISHILRSETVLDNKRFALWSEESCENEEHINTTGYLHTISWFYIIIGVSLTYYFQIRNNKINLFTEYESVTQKVDSNSNNTFCITFSYSLGRFILFFRFEKYRPRKPRQ
jgi:hypothetical protein